jgi:hypothetical protein
MRKFIENKLKLKVNEEKSKVAKSDKAKFLAMTIANAAIAISKKALDKAMEKVKELEAIHYKMNPKLRFLVSHSKACELIPLRLQKKAGDGLQHSTASLRLLLSSPDLVRIALFY